MMTLEPVSSVPAYLALVCIEGPLYGILTKTAISYVLFQARRYRRRDIYYRDIGLDYRALFLSPIFVCNSLLVLGSTLLWVVSVIRLFQAFSSYEGGGMPAKYLTGWSQPLYIVQAATIAICMIIGNAMPIYRLWVLSSHNTYIIIFPFATRVGFVTSSVGSIITATRAERPHDYQLLREVPKWNAGMICAICTELYAIAMISHRLLSTHAAVKGIYGGKGPMRRAFAVFIQNAAIILVLFILYYGVKEAGSELAITIGGSIPSVIGISHMRITMGWVAATTATQDHQLEFAQGEQVG
ncbi:hypothetical protein WOLCODRAFT_136544, partial [Wolfiporia cocos MD-104 SS10]